MKFSSILFPVLGCVSLVAALSRNARFVVRNINDLSRSSQDLGDVCQKLSTVNVRLNGPDIATAVWLSITPDITGLTKIVVAKQSPFNSLDAKVIVDAFLAFLDVQKQLLKTLIGKYGLLADFEFAAPIRIALVVLGKAIDDLAVGLIRLAPTNDYPFQREFDMAFDRAIVVYSRPIRADAGYAGEDRGFAAPAEAYYEYYLKGSKYYQHAA